MEQYILFNPKFLNNEVLKPKRKIKTAVVRPQTNNIIFPDYFKTDSQYPISRVQTSSSNFRYSRQLMKTSQKQNVEVDTSGFNESRAQTREKGKRNLDSRYFKSEYQSFYNMSGNKYRISEGGTRKIQSHKQPRYLVKKNNKWTINKIQKNIIRSSRQTKFQEMLLSQVRQTEDFMLMMSLSYGIQYKPTNQTFIIQSDSHPYIQEAIKRRAWWQIRDKDPDSSLIWKHKTVLSQSQKHKVLPLISINSTQFDEFKKEYDVSRMLWPNSKQRQNVPFIKPQPPYFSHFKQQLSKKIPSVSSKNIKLFSKIGHKKYLSNSSLFKIVQNNQKYYPKTYFQKQQNIPAGKWIISNNNGLKVVNQMQLKKQLQNPFHYYQSYKQYHSSESQQLRVKGIVLIVSLNGLLKAYIYQQFLTYSIQIIDHKIIKTNFASKQSSLLLHQVSLMINSLFSQIYKKLLTKVNCFELFEIEIIPIPNNPLFTSIKPVLEYNYPIYQRVIENIFLIVIDVLFRPEEYRYQNPYQTNKFKLMFDSFINKS